MDNLVGRIIRALEEPAGAGLEDALLDAAFLFEKSTLPRGEDTVEEFGTRMGWTSRVVRANVTDDELIRLKKALALFAEKNPDHRLVASALWALGKAYDDRSLLPVFVAALRRHLTRNAEVVYQILIGLRNLGEPVFPIPGGHSVLDVERSRELATLYLEKLERG